MNRPGSECLFTMIEMPMHCRRNCFLLMIVVLGIGVAHANAWAANYLNTLKAIQSEKLKTISSINAAVDRIEDAVKRSDQTNQLTFDLQKEALTKLGLCISSLVAIPDEKDQNSDRIRIFSTIRGVCKYVLAKNEKIIVFYQENKLDEMEDPTAFFKSDQWQHPQFLISLSSYWMGWNGYYGSLRYNDDEDVKKEMLHEAVKGFSRAIIDFGEEDVVTRSLLGRALCYSQLKEYEKAKMDFATIKRKLEKDHPLYFRCLYEENRLLYLTGNLDMALRGLNEIFEDYSDRQIPKELSGAFDQLKSKVLYGLMQHKGEMPSATDLQKDPIFLGLKQMAQKPGGVDAFYRYARENKDRLKKLPYPDIGPVGAVGLGDVYFENKEYQKALPFYLPVISEAPHVLASKMAEVRFRTAYIYCKTEKWSDAISLFSDFVKAYPDSYYLKQVVPLYYLAASNFYKQTQSQKAYGQFIESAGVYVTRCSGACPELSDAHFQLGLYHEKREEAEKAVTEFLHVKSDSQNYRTALFYLLKHYVAELEGMKTAGQVPSNESEKIYHSGLAAAKKYDSAEAAQKETSRHADSTAPYMVLLHAKLLGYGEAIDYDKILELLNGFEKAFPRGQDLFCDVFQIRAAALVHLKKMDAFSTELDRFVSAGPLNKDRYTSLKQLATQLYYGVEEGAAAKASGAFEYHLKGALQTYNILYNMSAANEAFKKEGEAIQLRMAQLYIFNDQLDIAERLYQDILKRNSLSADALYSLGLLYEKKEQWDAALATWRRFSDGVKTGTYHWYESRYKTAQAHIKLGNVKKACEIITITLVLHPDIGDAEMADKFQKLKTDNCEKSP